VDAVVRERFGGPACRIFRLLLLKRQLEQKQIAEMAMIPVKDTRELLYKLVKVEFVQLQEVARTADHSPSRTFYLWRVRLRAGLPPARRAERAARAQVDLLRVIDRLCTELYRTVSKVRARLLHEVQKEQEVMARLEAVAAGHAADGHTISLTAEQRSRLQRVRQVAAALEVSCMRLDQLALLFHDV
jgi:DNA-directed RNA polymerase III subunit RPC3